VIAAPADDPAVLARRGGREWLSLALLEARNELLARFGRLVPAGDEEATGDAASPAAGASSRPAGHGSEDALRLAPCLAARAAWFQEWWLARHVQRARGEAADPSSPRLPGLEPRAERWLRRARAEEAAAIREYLGQTLEQTLDLLGPAEDDDTGLYFFRLALQHEDRMSERLGHLLVPLLPPPRPQREPLGVPAQRWMLGSGAAAPGGGFVPHGERGVLEVAVPEFEIDAQCVNWAQYAEFAEDGGYDRRECWSDAGWAWLQQDGRRAPRDVEQLAGSVLVARGGQLMRAPAQQAAMHVSRHEAEAWCRWAGRRLPSEPEWELAAHVAARRGFAWGDVLEWVAGRARLFPGAGDRVPPGTLDVMVAATAPALLSSGESEPPPPCGVLRGSTSATPARWRHPKARRFALPHDDRQRSGFRSCAL